MRGWRVPSRTRISNGEAELARGTATQQMLLAIDLQVLVQALWLALRSLSGQTS